METPVVKELSNDVGQATDAWAWSSWDVICRKEQWGQLSGAEQLRLVKVDERKMLVGHLAEVAQLRVFPFRLDFIDGRLGSAVTIDKDDGEKVTVFRGMVDMLQARVNKYPDDKRAQMTLAWYERWIEPQVEAMVEGEWLTFFSPPDKATGFENRYGFVFLYQKRDVEVECWSVRLDWGKGNGYQATDLGVFGPEYQTPEQVLDYLGGEAGEAAGIFRGQLIKFQQIEAWVALNPDSESYYQALMRTDQNGMDRLVEIFRAKVMARYQPELWHLVQEQVSQFGFAVINIGCGPMMFGGVEPTDNILMGRGWESGYHGEWHKGNCRTCGATQVDVGDCEVCKRCQWEFDIGSRS